MSWINIFRSKEKPKPDPRIRWFGKLPTYSDYYSSPADEAWAVEFNEWILRGFQLYQSRLAGAKKRAGRLPVTGGAIRLPKSGMTVFASVLDFGGDMRGRPFPMCFYAGVPTADWPGPTSDHLAGAIRVVRDLGALRREVARFVNSPGRLETIFGDREVDLSGVDAGVADESWLAAAKKVPLADWFAGARDRMKLQDEARWLRTVTAWGVNLAKLDGKSFEPTLRFPLAVRVSLEAQIAGWIRWLETRMDLTERALSLIVAGDLEHESGHLTVIARALVPDDFLLITSLANTLSFLDDLSQKEPVGGIGLDATLGSDVRDPAGSAGSWVDFVQTAPAAT